MSEYRFDAPAVRDRLVQKIRSLAETQGFSRVVIGISGGKDSTVTAALCARALGPENVYGVMMPDGEQKDLRDSERVCASLGIPNRVVNIGQMHDALRQVTDQTGPSVTLWFSWKSRIAQQSETKCPSKPHSPRSFSISGGLAQQGSPFVRL